MINLAIVLGSSRKMSSGERIFLYLKSQAEELKEHGIQLQFLDLKEFDLPFFYEELAPRMNPTRRLEGKQQEWLDAIQEADGYLLLTPEYNWATTAVLRNALDYIALQMNAKAARVVSYAPHPGGGFAGGRDLEVLVGKLGAFVLPNPVTLRNVTASFSDSGEVLNESEGKVLQDALLQLAFYSRLFKENPYKPA